MKKKLLFAFSLLFCSGIAFSQEEENDTIPDGWRTEGNVQLLFNQSAFNDEWTGGGVSSIAGNLSVNYKFNYKKDKFTWNNMIFADY